MEGGGVRIAVSMINVLTFPAMSSIVSFNNWNTLYVSYKHFPAIEQQRKRVSGLVPRYCHKA